MIDLLDIDGMTILQGVWYWAWDGSQVVGAGKFTPDGTFWINGTGYAAEWFEYAPASVRDFDIYLDGQGNVHPRRNPEQVKEGRRG